MAVLVHSGTLQVVHGHHGNVRRALGYDGVEARKDYVLVGIEVHVERVARAGHAQGHGWRSAELRQFRRGRVWTVVKGQKVVSARGFIFLRAMWLLVIGHLPMVG